MSSFEYHGGGIYSRRNRRDGRTQFFIRYTLPNGKRKKEKAGTRKTGAKRLLEKRRTEIVLGTYRDPAEAKARHMRFGELVTAFLAGYCGRRRSNYYEQRLQGLRDDHDSAVAAFFAAYTIEELEDDPTIFDRFRDERGEKASPSTVRKELTSLGTVFRWAMKQRPRLAQANPLDSVDKPANPHPEVRPLSLTEWRALVAAAEPWLRPILRMAGATGARLKEVVGLTWERVDVREGVIYISADNKTGRPRAIPLSGHARAVLEDTQDSRFAKGPVFRDGELDYTTARQRNRISQRTVAAAKCAGLASVSFKSARTMVGSALASMGESELLIGRLLGHASTSVTGRHYVGTRVADLRGTVATLDRWLAGSQESLEAKRSC